MYEYQVLINYEVRTKGSYEHCLNFMIRNRNKVYTTKVWELRQVVKPLSVSDDIVAGYAPRNS